MNRIPFVEKLKHVSIDIKREYRRLYELFYQREYSNVFLDSTFTLKEVCEDSFTGMPETFRGTCISLEDFNENHGFRFPAKPKGLDMNFLIAFGEYSYNLILNCLYCDDGSAYETEAREAEQEYLRHVEILAEKIGFMLYEKEGLFELVPIDQAAISVSEIIDDISYRVIEYNHQSMRGDIEGKKAILIELAGKLEPLRSQLKNTDKTLEDDLFMLLNNLNIRHNNIEKGSSKYIPYIAEMDRDDLEKWYDDIYQMCLLAFLELDNVDRKKRVDELKKAIKQK